MKIFFFFVTYIISTSYEHKQHEHKNFFSERITIFRKISQDFGKTIKKASIAKGLLHCLLPDRQHILSMSLRMYDIPLSRVC